jgi:Rrf2 family protein
MKLSTQEEYGLRCLLQLARHGDSASLTISEMSQREGISAPNVAKILRLLRRASLLTSTRGKAGGYTLARSASEITVGEVLSALGGRLWDPAFCERHAGGPKSAPTSASAPFGPSSVMFRRPSTTFSPS